MEQRTIVARPSGCTGGCGTGRRGTPRRALHELDNYLRGQSARLVNYAERYRAGMRVGTSVTEGTANFLVDRRMNKAKQIDSLDAVPTCCCRSGARFTTMRSDRESAVSLSRSPSQTGNSPWLPDPQKLICGRSLSSHFPCFLSFVQSVEHA